MRWLHLATNGRAQAALLRVTRRRHLKSLGPSQLPRVRPQDEGEIARLVDELRSDGYTVLPWRLSQGACNETIALTRAGRLVPLDGPYVNRVVSMSAHHKSLVLSVPVSDALSLPAVQHIVSDPNLYAVASRYLREPTVIGGRPFLRWTLPSALDDSEFKRHQAGYFHQDFDALSSVRLFVYLTDVGPQDAPLVLIPGSHRAGRARRALQSAWRRGK